MRDAGMLKRALPTRVRRRVRQGYQSEASVVSTVA
jgi:hypothetical protein